MLNRFTSWLVTPWTQHITRWNYQKTDIANLSTYDSVKNGKKKYFRNNWSKWKAVPDEFFEPIDFDEIMEWKVAGWELPMDVVCLIRATNKDTKKVKEFVYKQRKAADNRIKQLTQDQKLELCITTHEAQHYLSYENNDEGDI